MKHPKDKTAIIGRKYHYRIVRGKRQDNYRIQRRLSWIENTIRWYPFKIFGREIDRLGHYSEIPRPSKGERIETLCCLGLSQYKDVVKLPQLGEWVDEDEYLNIRRFGNYYQIEFDSVGEAQLCIDKLIEYDAMDNTYEGDWQP